MDALLRADIGRSGIDPRDINARSVSQSELAATNSPTTAVDSYVIPYYNIQGNPTAFYRIKFLSHEPKYKQPRNSGNHVYFPPNLAEILRRTHTGQKFILLTEGEKKAAAAVKHGIPCASLGGVDNWRDRTLLLPKDTELKTSYSNDKALLARLPSTSSEILEISTLAQGMQELIDLLLYQDYCLIIVFDTDVSTGLKPDVQRAAAQLGYELRFGGVPAKHIRMLILPPGKSKKSKMGLDDYIVREGKSGLLKLIDNTLNARGTFPRHPNPRQYLNAALQKGRLSRKEAQSLSLAVLTELDARGRRLINHSDGTPYFFNEDTFQLMPARLMHKHGEPLHESAFGGLLYKEFGLTPGDSKIINWLASQFTGEDPIESVEPKKILHTQNDSISLQISDSQFVRVTADPKEPIKIYSNGSKGLLFEQDHVEAIDGDELLAAFKQQAKSKKPLSWWYKVLGKVNLKGGNEPRTLLTLLSYMNPWLNKWRGLQLPIEILTGEAGSGKSSLYMLRLDILTGRPILRNLPQDLRDWYSSIVNTGGLHVTDNVHFTSKEIRQKVSDEICRIITEPDPHIEMRRLYATTSQMRIPVRTTFAMTAIQLPFYNADIIQRSAIFKLLSVEENHDGDWVKHRLNEFGTRTDWVAHHLLVLHRFLVKANDKKIWKPNFKAKHRLTHYEQSLGIMGDVLGLDVSNLSDMLMQQARVTLSETDWAMEGLGAFGQYMKASDMVGLNSKFTVAEIVSWAQASDEFMDNNQLTNTRSLGRYLQAHSHSVQSVSGITETLPKNNRKQYYIQT